MSKFYIFKFTRFLLTLVDLTSVYLFSQTDYLFPSDTNVRMIYSATHCLRITKSTKEPQNDC